MNNIKSSKASTTLGALLLMSISFFATDPPEALAAEANYDESKIPPYTLPDLLVTDGGGKVDSVQAWENTRRPQILELFREHMFGRDPGRPDGVTYEKKQIEVGSGVFGEEVLVKFGPEPDAPSMRITVFRRNLSAKSGMFVGLNLYDPGDFVEGYHGRIPRIRNAWEIPPGWEEAAPPRDFRELLSERFGVATISPADFAPDDKETFEQGIINYFRKKSGASKKGDDWGAIGAWAWALSRAMDYFETDPFIDPKRVIVIGHSRMGKTALWAGAQDPRFAAVISNESGCGGAALSRRAIGETVKMINDRFPHWFCDNFKKYNDRENDLPLDQHMLIALTAPRPVYIASAEEDKWADPKGEFLAASMAEPVWGLYGLTGLGQKEPPKPNLSVGDHVAYHIRTGKHALTSLDWSLYLDFATRHFPEFGKSDNKYEVGRLKDSNGRAWRVGPNLFIKIDGREEPLIFNNKPMWRDRGGAGTLWFYWKTFDKTPFVTVSRHGNEYATDYLVNINTGDLTDIAGPPIFSPDRKRFVTEDFKSGFDRSKIIVWRLDDWKPFVEWERQTAMVERKDLGVKWLSKTRFTFMEGHGNPATITATYKNKQWKFEPF